jgi:hypothetical protein
MIPLLLPGTGVSIPPEGRIATSEEVRIMMAKLGLSGLLAAMVVAAAPGASSAGWGSVLTSDYRSAFTQDSGAAEVASREAGEASGDSVFKLTCSSCGRCGYGCCYPAYGSCYPSCGYYSGYGSYGGYGYYSGYSYYPSVSYYPGCNSCSPCGCRSIWGYYSGW